MKKPKPARKQKVAKPSEPQLDPQAPSAAEPGETTGPLGPAVQPIGTKVPGVLDSQLHPSLHEAHRVLTVGRDAFAKVLDQVEGQFVRPLANAHDGDAAHCSEIQRQIAAFRELYR